MEASDLQKNVDVDIAKTQCTYKVSYLNTAFFRAENWFAALKGHTFDTTFVNLTLQESKVLLRYR